MMNNGLIEPEMEAVGEVEMINYVDLTENDSTPECEQVMSLFIDMGSGATLDVISNANRRYPIDYDIGELPRSRNDYHPFHPKNS
jgi:hypothetical protein